MKRRDFIAGAAGLIGTSVTGVGRAEIKPCPPPSIQVTGGTNTAETCVAVTGGSAPIWLQGRAIGEWFEVPNTRLSSCPPSQGAQFGSPGAKINTWNGAALRRKDSVYLIAAAGGHGDYGGNEVNALRLNVDSPAWVELRPSTLLADMVDMSGVYRDYRCASVHQYNGLQFVNQDDRLAVMPYAGMGPSGLPDASSEWQTLYPSGRMLRSFKAVNWFAYDAGNDWDRAEIMASSSSPREGYYRNAPSNHNRGPWGTARCNDPLTGDLYTGDSAYGLWKWTRATNTWSQVTSAFANAGYGAAIAIDQVVRNGETSRRILLVKQGGEAGAGVFRADTGAKIAVTLDNGSLAWSVLEQDHYNGIVYDEPNDRFIAFMNGVDGNFAQYEVRYTGPATYRITKIPVRATSGSTVPNFTNRNGIHNAVQYVPELKGVVVADQYDGNVHFMRTA